MKRVMVGAAFALAFGPTSPVAADEANKTPTYLLANLFVEDFETYSSNYASHLGPLLPDASAEVLVVAPDVTKLEGDNGANLTVVVRFPSLDAAEAYFRSDAYAALKPVRISTTNEPPLFARCPEVRILGYGKDEERNTLSRGVARQYARIVRDWVTSIGLEATAYGTHSMRRTKVTQIYKKTGNLRAVQLLLGHTKMDSTVRYLGVELEDALAIAEAIEI